jgi:hypothetical protein
MIICPWCGTNYLTFQTNCDNCGGPLQAVDEKNDPSTQSENLLAPPSIPRPISEKYVWRILSSDGWWIASLVLGFLGFIFSLIGVGLTLGIITAFVGIPFLIIGLVLLGIGGSEFVRRYQNARKVVTVLREGETTQGQIVEIQEDYSVRVNGRYPWRIRYQFQADGQDYEGTVTTFNQPGQELQAGKTVYVLYLPIAPKWNSIYPHP